MSKNSPHLSHDLPADQYRELGLAKVDFDGNQFLRAIPSLSPFFEFGEGFYHYEIEHHGRWCSEHGHMLINLGIGEWQIVILIGGGQLWKFPDVTSPDVDLQIRLVEGNEYWDAAVIDLKMLKPCLKLEFRGKHVFTPPDTEKGSNPRRLSFWMIDEFLFRPANSLLHTDINREIMPEHLLSGILAAPVVSAVLDKNLQENGLVRLASDKKGAEWGLTIAVVADGVILGRPALLGLYRSNELLILQETTPYQNRFSNMKLSNLRSLKKATHSSVRFGQVAPLCCEWSDNIWHWFLENIPQVVALEASEFQGLYLIPFNAPIYRESLLLLGIDSTRICEFVYDYVQADELFVTDRFTGQEIGKYERIVLELNRKFTSLRIKPDASRLYISRKGNRRVLNENIVMETLSKYNFSLVHMEDYSITEQISLAASAEFIIGPHGAGMTAAMFMKPGGGIMELFAPTYVNPCMTAVCQVLEHKYFMLTSRVFMDKEYPYSKDINVDIPELKLILRTALG